MPTDRHVIDSRGRFRWQLAVVGTDVTASRHLPTADGSTFYSTADFGLTTRDAGGDCLSADRVVVAYCRESTTDRSFTDLRAAVETAIDAPAPTDGRAIATDGGHPTESNE